MVLMLPSRYGGGKVRGFIYPEKERFSGGLILASSHEYLTSQIEDSSTCKLSAVALDISETATYTYDGDGYRVKKVVGATTSTYAWDRLGAGGLGTVVGDGSAEYVFGPAGLQQRTAGSASQYAQGDGLGSVRLITDGSGNAAGAATFEPWGAPQAGSATLGGFGFTGEQTDAETGFVYLPARHYDPATGRFLQADPLGLGGGSTNVYAYVGNSPTNAVDPSGAFAIPWPAAGPAALAAAEALETILVGAGIVEVGTLALVPLLVLSTGVSLGALIGCVAISECRDGVAMLFGTEHGRAFCAGVVVQGLNQLFAIYHPERPLPRDPAKGNRPVPESDYPHTQLVQRGGDRAAV